MGLETGSAAFSEPRACAPCGVRRPGRETVPDLGEVFLCCGISITGACLRGTAPNLATYALGGSFQYICLVPILKCK